LALFLVLVEINHFKVLTWMELYCCNSLGLWKQSKCHLYLRSNEYLVYRAAIVIVLFCEGHYQNKACPLGLCCELIKFLLKDSKICKNDWVVVKNITVQPLQNQWAITFSFKSTSSIYPVAYAEHFRGKGQSIGVARGGPKGPCLPPNL